MPTNADVLTLTQWLSPGYPVGAFAYSHGLESAVGRGWVSDGAGLERWLRRILHHGSGQADATFLAAGWQADTRAELTGVDQIARAYAPCRERLQETQALGAAFMRVTGAIWGIAPEPLTYPVALGFAANAAGIDQTLTSELYLQAFLANLIACGQRLLPLGQTPAQAMLRGLTTDCIEVAARTAHGEPTQIASHSFSSDIAAMTHETQYSRIFRT